jgi:hypothetical protein
MSGVDLAPETTTSVVSTQHANPKRTDDASALAKGLLGVSLVPNITVQSVPRDFVTVHRSRGTVRFPPCALQI